MAYTDIDKPSDYFNTVLYTGNGSSGHSITGVGFQPDMTWIKIRNQAYDHALQDSVRGATKDLEPNQTSAEDTRSMLTAFASDGFTLGSDSQSNSNSNTFVAWNWKAGTSFTNDASSTGIGTIDSAGSVNQDAGFSICSYTGTGSAGTIKHGLNAVPSVVIVKPRNSSSEGWSMYHKGIASDAETDNIRLDEANAAFDNAGYWNDTAPTSTVFSIGTDSATNGTTNNIAYCFAEKKGYSKFGSYTGNGNADGTFVYTGFKPAWVMIKRTDSGGNWNIMDNKRIGYNPDNNEIRVHESSGEQTSDTLDILSNGFKMRSASGSFNESGGSYIYMAFASNPFTTSTGVPATAR